MRILLVITDLEVGGAPLFLVQFAKWLVKNGSEAGVVCMGRRGPVAERFDEMRIPVFACNAWCQLDLGALWRLRKTIRSQRPDVIQSFLFHANLAVRLVGPSAGVPPERIVNEIVTVEIERKQHLIIDRWSIGRCAVEVGNSQSVIEHLHRAAGIPTAKLLLIRHGIDANEFASASQLPRTSFKIVDEDPILLWTGRLDPVKGFDVMISAFALVNKARPSHLLLVGEGFYRTRIEALIRTNDVRDRVHLLGRRDDVPGLLKLADGFVFSSRTEGLPTSVLEAMAAGVPVVATDVPGNRDIVQHEETGLLVRPNDPKAMADGILRILSAPELAKRLANRAFEFVSTRFRQEENFEKHLRLYRRLLSLSPR